MPRFDAGIIGFGISFDADLCLAIDFSSIARESLSRSGFAIWSLLAFQSRFSLFVLSEKG